MKGSDSFEKCEGFRMLVKLGDRVGTSVSGHPRPGGALYYGTVIEILSYAPEASQLLILTNSYLSRHDLQGYSWTVGSAPRSYGDVFTIKTSDVDIVEEVFVEQLLTASSPILQLLGLGKIEEVYRILDLYYGKFSSDRRVLNLEF